MSSKTPNEIAIKCDSLSKCYQVFDKPQDSLKQVLHSHWSKLLGRPSKNFYHEFWSLKDISFEIAKGESIGVIGVNGSGKSTLLQSICGILEATTGSLEIHGRIAALLELGSGFDPEFSGRENVYINASILGLKRQDIEERFEGIVAFADIGKFIDMPVKTYSSGMALRLAFAVIAHVNADVILVDEALSVGDAAFNQKCMRYIREFQKQGTLVLVSHDINAIKNLCHTVIWLDEGHLKMIGPAKEVTEAYLQHSFQTAYGKEFKLTSAPVSSPTQVVANSSNKLNEEGNPVVCVSNNLDKATGWTTGQGEIQSVVLTSLAPRPEGVFEGGEAVRIAVRAKIYVALENPILSFIVRDYLGQDLFGQCTLSLTEHSPVSFAKDTIIEATFDFNLPMLPNGQYVVMSSLADGSYTDNTQLHWMNDALIINVYSSKIRHGLVGIPIEKVQLHKVSED